jgi:hypothetical protein
MHLASEPTDLNGNRLEFIMISLVCFTYTRRTAFFPSFFFLSSLGITVEWLDHSQRLATRTKEPDWYSPTFTTE